MFRGDLALIYLTLPLDRVIWELLSLAFHTPRVSQDERPAGGPLSRFSGMLWSPWPLRLRVSRMTQGALPERPSSYERDAVSTVTTHFGNDAGPLIAQDPDGLLQEEGIAQPLRRDGVG
jgi:hypothetical protein